MKQVKSIDVKRSFILAHAMKHPFESGKKISPEDLMKMYNGALEKYSKLDEHGLEVLINGLELGRSLEGMESSEKSDFKEDQDRIRRYKKLSWSYGLIELSNIGAWPEMRGIDPRLTTGSIIKTAKEIKDYSCGKSEYDFSDERKNNLDKLLELIESMGKNELIFRLPIILVPGDSVRGEAYKQWVAENHGDYHEHDTSLLGIDEGNVRAVINVFAGKDKVFSYVGKYIN